jgi:hypothetical protein
MEALNPTQTSVAEQPVYNQEAEFCEGIHTVGWSSFISI